MTRTATAAGLVDLIAPDPALLTPAAMAAGLAKLNRFAGNTQLPFSVAQHSVLVRDIFVRIAPGLAPWSILALLHDGHEYLIGDVIGPLEQLLNQRLPGFSRELERIKLTLDADIRRAWGLPSPWSGLLFAIHEADQHAAWFEWASLMSGENHFKAPDSRIVRNVWRAPLPWTDAADLFLTELERELGMKPWENVA